MKCNGEHFCAEVTEQATRMQSSIKLRIMGEKVRFLEVSLLQNEVGFHRLIAETRCALIELGI